MQLLALNVENQLVEASFAQKKCDYFCMECGKLVRLRGGTHRQNHFYHLKPDPKCRQSQKSLQHLQVQNYLYNLLPIGCVQLEKRFPEIARIADVVWEDQKIVFEVQCSPITQKEVESRNRDYGRMGYQVVWILHEKRFIKRKVSAAEEWLNHHLLYYTNFDANGFGEIYDQLHVFNRGLRRYSSKRSIVNLNFPRFLPDGLCFDGDWRDRVRCSDPETRETWKRYRREKKKWESIRRNFSLVEIKRWYLNCLNLILEKCCR